MLRELGVTQSACFHIVLLSVANGNTLKLGLESALLIFYVCNVYICYIDKYHA